MSIGAKMPNPLYTFLVTRVVPLIGMLAGSFNSAAAQFNLSDANYSVCDKLTGESVCIAVRMTGKIEPGDSAKLEQTIEKLERAGVRNTRARVAAVVLDSSGGSVAEALTIGRFIRARQIWTQVGVNDRCASSCVLVLAGGVARFPFGTVEVHSFYSPEVLGSGDFSKAEKMYTEIAEQIAAYLKEMRVTTALLDEMMQIPHYTSRQLKFEEIKRFGLFGMDPVYAQVRPQPKSRKSEQR